ncbi:MAG: DUF6600 domain-containing protein [Thermoanaerobaculia bacterium]
MNDSIKSTRNVLFALLLLSSVAGAASASTSVAAGIHIGPSGRATVDLGFFYDDLAPYGNWIERPSYGWVWTPTVVSTSWRPYQDGHWVWTDDGWVWVTDEPYGWATYHYGRWYDDPEIGWAWVPGDEWGPSWVSWQAGADYVGWAPLPPGVSVSVSTGGGYVGYAYGIAPEDYVFVPERDFLAPRLATYAVPYTRVRSFWGQTRNYTNYRFNGGRVFNQGIPVDQVQRFVGRRVPRYQVADLGADYKRYRGGARIQGDRLAIFRPQVQKAARVTPLQRAAARRAVVSAAQFKAAHPQRVAFAQRQRQQRAEVRGQALQQRQTRVDQRQAKIDRQQVRVDRAQQRQAQVSRQQQKVQQRQTRVDQRQARVDHQRVKVDRAQQRQAQSFRQQQKLQRQTRVDQRQARVDRQQVRVDRAQQRQAQAFRQQQRGAAQQQRQARIDRQQVRVDRQQARVNRAQQRQAAQQQRAAQRQGGGGRGQGGGGRGQGGGGRHGHGRPPGV